MNHDRRELLRRAARWLALGLLGGGAAALVARRGAPAGERCSGGGICRGCAAYDGCGLPTALTMKQAVGEKG